MIYFKNGSYILSTIELDDSDIDDKDIYSDGDRDINSGCEYCRYRGSVVGSRYLDTFYMTVTVLELIIKNIFRRYK